MTDKQFDIVLWGATGFTGRLVAEYLAERAKNHQPTLRFAIGGRSQVKLDAVHQALKKINPNLDIGILIADSDDQASLNAMVRSTKVIASTVGPFQQYGSKLVATCALAGTHYCDITGEAIWIADMISRHQAAANKSGARIVHCCGYDSIPSDLGTLMVQQEFERRHGRPAHQVRLLAGKTKGTASGGTAATMLATIDTIKKEPQLRKLLADPYSLYPVKPKPEQRYRYQSGPRFDEHYQVWTGPFMMASINVPIVMRSNAVLSFAYGNDFRYDECMILGTGVAGRVRAAAFTAGLGIFALAAVLPPSRALLKRFVIPEPGEGPDQEAREAGFFNSHLVAFDEVGGKQARVDGLVQGFKDPGYGETAKMLGESALCLAFDELTSQGGILTPASAMGTTLIERLINAGMIFKIVDSKIPAAR